MNTYWEPAWCVVLCQVHMAPSLPASLKEQGPPIAKSNRWCSGGRALLSCTLLVASNTLDPWVLDALLSWIWTPQVPGFLSPLWPLLSVSFSELFLGCVFLIPGVPQFLSKGLFSSYSTNSPLQSWAPICHLSTNDSQISGSSWAQSKARVPHVTASRTSPARSLTGASN